MKIQKARLTTVKKQKRALQNTSETLTFLVVFESSFIIQLYDMFLIRRSRIPNEF